MKDQPKREWEVKAFEHLVWARSNLMIPKAKHLSFKLVQEVSGITMSTLGSLVTYRIECVCIHTCPYAYLCVCVWVCVFTYVCGSVFVVIL